jgi:hypothetical protein
VDGDVTINADITAPVGSFFIIIASGNITFADGVLHAQGMFVADKKIVIADSTVDTTAGTEVAGRQFKGEGSFIGWGGVSLNRSLKSTSGDPLADNKHPGELFTYRADFLLNAPNILKRPQITWKEVAPRKLE